MTEYLRSNAHRAGLSEAEFWAMTAHGVISAVDARRVEASENMSRLAYRVARLSRVQHKHFPRTEASMFAAAKPKRQSIDDQFATAQLITSAMRH